MKIKNLLFQPLALHLATDEGLHLSARECRDIVKEHVSEEIRLAAARGLVSLIEKATTAAPQAAAETERADEARKGKAR